MKNTISTPKVNLTNLRDLLCNARSISAMMSQDRSTENFGIVAETPATIEQKTRLAAILSDAEYVYKELLRAGRVTPYAMRGIPGETHRARWTTEIAINVNA